MAELAPILLFTYKRLNKLKETVAALQRNHLASDSELIIFSDAAKSPKDEQTVTEVRSFLKTITGFQTIRIFEAEKNKGLANSIINGVSQEINRCGKVIVLEDDLATTPNFLTFMNDCLDRYEKEKKVFSVSGYSFDLGKKDSEPADAYFLNRGWSWGWATWQNRWNEVDWQVKDYAQFKNDSKARKMFALGGSDVNDMLDKQMSGTLDSWAIRWFYYQFRIKGLTLYPVFSKVYNNGFDEDATHTTGSDKRYKPLLDIDHSVKFELPKDIDINEYYQKQFQLKMGIWSRVISKLETLYHRIIN